ncbi:hypothetical protein PMAYCL1PPCAC_08304, partial [Pristionchus mayeri]
CIVCHRRGDLSEMRMFTTSEKKRETWVAAVRSTMERRRTLMKQLSASKRPFLCTSHFSPSDFNHYDTSGFVLKPYAVPSFNDSEFDSDGVMDVPLSSNGTPNDREEDHPEINDEPANDIADNTKKEQNADIQVPHIGNSPLLFQFTPRDHSDVPSKAQKLKCFVCCQMVVRTEMRLFALNHTKRKAWINSVRSTPEGRRSLMAQLSAVNYPMLCNNHFSPSSFIHAANRVILRGDAIPFFEDSVLNSGSGEHIHGSAVDSSNESRENTLEIKAETVDGFADLNQKEPTSDPFVCLHCGEQFDQMIDLGNHLLDNPTHLEPNERKITIESSLGVEPIDEASIDEQPAPT